MTFEEYATEQLPALLATARLISSNPALAEDLVQDVLIKLHARWDTTAALGCRHGTARRGLTRVDVADHSPGLVHSRPVDTPGDPSSVPLATASDEHRTPDLRPDRVPEGVTLELAATALRERIYGSIACLSTLLVITGYSPLEHPWEKALDVLIATGGLYTASVLSEYVAHLGIHKVTPDRKEIRHIFWVSGQIMAASAIPLVLLVLAGIHALSLHTAVWVGVWVLVAEMGLFALFAVRKTALSRWGRTLLVGALLVLGVAVVFLKTLAH